MSTSNNQVTTAVSVTNLISGTPAIIMSGIIAIGLYVWSFISISNFVGSKDDWNSLKPQITKIWSLTLAGSFALFIASLLYFIQDPQRAIYFILALSCLTLGLSYSALAISAISR
jgi:hypothetical protein